MTETGQDFTVYRGEDKTVEVIIAGSGSIDGWTLKASFRKSNREVDAVPPLIEKTSGDGITITDPVARTVEIALTSTDTAMFFDGIEERKYPWDLWRTNANSKSPGATGIVTVKNPASR